MKSPVHFLKNHWPELIVFAVVLYFLKDILFFGKIFVTPGLGLGDYTFGALPLTAYYHDHLQHGHFPLWSPEIYSGFPITANAESQIFYPINTLLTFIFPAATALNLHALFTFLILGFSTFYFVKSLKLSKEAALVSALSLTFAAGTITRIMHLPVLEIRAYIPLGFLLIQKYFAKRNPLLLVTSAVILSFQFLNYNPPTTIICWMGFCLFFIFKALTTNQPKGFFKKILPLSVVVTVAILLCAIQLLPNLQLALISQRTSNTAEEPFSLYPFHPPEIKYLLRPAPFGDPSLGNYNSPHPTIPSIFWENNTYIGIAGLLLGLLAIIFVSRHNREALFFSFLFVLSLLFGLGKNTPLIFLLKLPPLSLIRIPGRFLFLAMPSLAFLSAYGFDLLAEKLKLQKQLMIVPLAAFILFDLFSFGLGFNPTYAAKQWLAAPQTAHFLKQDESFFRIYNLGEYDAYYLTYRQTKGWRLTGFSPYFQLRETLAPELNMMYGLNHASGVLGLRIARSDKWDNYLKSSLQINQDEHTILLTSQAIKMLQSQNVKYIISIYRILNQEFSLKKTITGYSDLFDYYIYELKNILPHAFIVNQVVQVNNNQDTVFKNFLNDSFDPVKTVLLEESFPELPELPQTITKEIVIEQYLPEKVVIKAKTNAPAFLVLTDSNFPGWQATDNNQPTKIYQANYLFRAVHLETGEHSIIFEYKPKLFYLGAVISGVTLIFLIIYSLIYILRKRS